VTHIDIEFVLGDLTTETVDVIVNAANESLRGGGGVDGAIHSAGGPTILAECLALGGCPTGSARITGAGQLPARWVVHAVGPRWRGGGSNEEHLLASAHTAAIELAAGVQACSISFPALSCGIFGYPAALAAPVAIGSVRAALSDAPSLERVRFVFIDEQLRGVFERAG
jgi:O-acetyl-ADP-ribose deacetylase (regulator of RNase III)